jgi:iron complex transport system substrate-binding protein
MLSRVLLAVVFFLISSAAYAEEGPTRIVSLAPGMTEILYALGLGENIVGVTTFCDYPPEAAEKPKIGGMSNPSLEAVFSSKPDVVVMTTDGNPKGFEPKLEALGLNTYVFTARRLHELPDAIRHIGSRLDAANRAEELASGIQEKLDEYEKTGEKTARSLKVLFIVWPEPLIVAGKGTVIDDGIKLLGHNNIASSSRINYPKYSLEEVLSRAPDVILFGGEGGHGEMRKVSARILERIKSTPAVKEGRVFYLGDGLMRYGPRVIEGMDELSKILKQESAER